MYYVTKEPGYDYKGSAHTIENAKKLILRKVDVGDQCTIWKPTTRKDVGVLLNKKTGQRAVRVHSYHKVVRHGKYALV